MNAESNPRAVIGGNEPPEPIPGLALANAPQGPSQAQEVAEVAPDLFEQDEPVVDPAILAQIAAKTAQFTKAAQAWGAAGAILTEDEAKRLVDFTDGAKKVYGVIEKLRTEAKKPYDAKIKVIQDAFGKYKTLMEKAMDRVKPLSDDYLTLKKQRLEAERVETARIAAEAKAKAEADLLAAQASGDINAEVEAEQAAKEATKLEKVAARPVKASVGSASGAGRTQAQRRSLVIEVTNQRLAVMHFSEAPELRECLRQLAATAARAAGVDAVEKGEFSIPGFTIQIKESL